MARMEEKDTPDVASTNVSEQNDDIARDNAQGGAGMLEKQTRTRRLFNTPQLFAFSLVYLGTWYSIATNMYFALNNGGPAAWFWSYIIVLAGVLCQAATFGEMASIQPIAGAQYYWTWNFSPPSCRRFLTWMQGWMTWTGYVALLASCLNGNTLVLEGMIQLTHPDYEPGGWHTTLIIFATIAFCSGINLFAFRLVPWFELLSGILNVCMLFIFLVVLWVMSPRNSTDIFFQSNVSSGWDNYFVAANLGALSNIFLFCSFESVIHMGEETRNAKRAVPTAMFWAIFTNGILGLIMIITFAICMPSVDILLNSSSPLVTIILNTTGSAKATTAMVSGLVVLGISGNMGVVSSVSRLTWAWARDGGLPQYFGIVDSKSRVPARAIIVTSIIVLLLSLLNIGSSSYIALNAIVSLSSLAIYMSYAIVLACVLYARLTNGLELGQWNLGRAGTPVNIFGLVYTLYAMIWLPFPTDVPATASNMNYCGPVFGVVLVAAITLWFIRAQRGWDGPNRAVVDFVLKSES
ncbi:amino acid permease [Diaporthe sp. PMI_573]|nr:amino acid permease [Diaporthaceae sp. PMI_573]